MAVFEDIIIRVTSQGTKEVAQGLGAIGKEAQSTTGALAALNRIAYTLAGAFSIKALADYADQYSNLTNQLKLVTKSAGELQATQDRLFKTAQESRTSVKSLTDLYVALSMSQKETGISGERLHRVVGVISKTLTVSGASASTASNALRQLVQGLQSGKLGGEELKSVLENTRYTAQALAKGLGVTVGQLRKMGEEGKLTGRVVAEAFLKMEAEVNRDFGKTSITISQGLQLIDDAFMRFIGTTGETSGTISVIATGLRLIAENLPAIVTGLAVLTAAWVTYRVAVIAVAAAQWLANAAIAASPIGRVVTVIAAVISLMVLYSASVKGVIPLLKEWWDTAKGLYEFLLDKIKGIIEGYNSVTETISTSAKSWGESISSFIETTKQWFMDWYEYLKTFFTETIPNTVKSGLESVQQFFIDIWTKIKSFVVGILDSIVQSIQNMVNRAKSLLQQIMSYLNQGQSAQNQLNSLTQEMRQAKTEDSLREQVNTRRVEDLRTPDAIRTPDSIRSPDSLRVPQEINTPNEIRVPETSVSNVLTAVKDILVGKDPRDNANLRYVPGQRATGGPVSGNSPYIVGENGPEVFVPGSNGTILPNGSGGDALATGSPMTPTKAVELLAEGVKLGVKDLEELLKTLVENTTVKSGSSFSGSSSGGSSSGSSPSSSGGNNMTSALNNYVQLTGGDGSGGQAPSSGSGGGSLPGSTAERGISNTSNDDVLAYVKGYYDLIVKNWDTKGMYLTDKQRERNYLNEQRYLANVPSSLQETVQQLANARLTTKTTGFGFRSGGAFSISGGTGVDSKIVPIAASPGERVDIRTRKQVRDEQGMGGGDTHVSVSMVVNTPDADSFRKSEKQISREFLTRMAKVV